MIDIITPAVQTPNIIDIIAFLNGIFKNAAATAAVQAPVPGKGIATNKNNPNVLYLSIDSEPFWAFVSILSTNLTNLVPFR